MTPIRKIVDNIKNLNIVTATNLILDCFAKLV